MKRFGVMYQVKATGKIRIAQMNKDIQTEEDVRKAMNIRFGDNIEIMAIEDLNDEEF